MSRASDSPSAVQRLWNRVRRRFRHVRRRLRFTREGRVFVLLAFGIGIGAVNTGNNLLYLLLGAMLAFIVLSGVLAEISLRGVKVWRRVPSTLHAGRETLIRLGVHNCKQHLPSFSLSVRETFGRKRTLDPVSFVHLAPDQREEDGYRCVFPRRGRCRFRGWTLETTFPFGLFRKSRFVDGEDTAIVFPRIDLPLNMPRLPGAGAGMGSARRSDGEEFYALRDYRPGDDRRRISWKASARRGALVMREHARGAHSSVELVLVNVSASSRRDPLFESMLDHAGTLAVMLLETGYEVGLSSLEDPVPPGSGPAHRRRLLTALAVMRQVEQDDASTRVVQTACPSTSERVLIETRHSRPFRPALPSNFTVVEVTQSSLELLENAGRATLSPADSAPDEVLTPPSEATRPPRRPEALQTGGEAR